MRKIFGAVCALALSAAMLTGCGCSNSNAEPTILPTNVPTTQATAAPTTRPTTAPTTMPNTEAPSMPDESQSGGNGESGNSTESGGTNGSSEAPDGARSGNRMPGQSGK